MRIPPIDEHSVTFKSTEQVDDDLAWLAGNGYPALRAVTEGLLILFGIVCKHGIDGYLSLDRVVAGRRTVSATPLNDTADDPATRTLKADLSDEDDLLLAVLVDRLGMTAQDVVRHAIGVLRTLTEHATVGGVLTPVGPVHA